MIASSDILTSWKACQPVLSEPTGWLVLLRIAAAGADGITKTKAIQNLNKCRDWRTFETWEKAGPIRIEKVMRARRIFIQEKGLKLLRVAS